ncbi:MAG: hypothetical protein WA970_04710 [Gammaproteobacteria bacterium]
MKALIALGTLLIIVQLAVLIVLHRRRQRFRQEREKFLAELDDLENKRTTSTRNE